MPIDEQTRATARALLDRHPRGYAAELGYPVTRSAKGLFRLLCLSILADDSAPSPATMDAARALFEPEVAPFVDERARRAAERLGLPSDPQELMGDVARGTRHEQLAWLVGALALVDRGDEYDRIRAAA